MDALKIYDVNGAKLVDLSLPHCEYAVATYYIIATAEASSNLARYDGVRYGHRSRLSSDSNIVDMYSQTRAEGFGNEVKRRILLGNYALSTGYYEAYYLKASKVRNVKKNMMTTEKVLILSGAVPGLEILLHKQDSISKI